MPEYKAVGYENCAGGTTMRITETVTAPDDEAAIEKAQEQFSGTLVKLYSDWEIPLTGGLSGTVIWSDMA